MKELRKLADSYAFDYCTPLRDISQPEIEELAHRRCKRYIHIDTEAPYQFDGRTLMDFVRDVQAWKPKMTDEKGRPLTFWGGKI